MGKGQMNLVGEQAGRSGGKAHISSPSSKQYIGQLDITVATTES